MGHENKCAHMHGHEYSAEIEVGCNDLDAVGRVIDFGVLKEQMDPWIQDNWDHAFIVNCIDAECIAALESLKCPPQKMFQLDFNPTAENLAYTLFGVAEQRLSPQGLRVLRVTVHETPKCFATVYWNMP